MTEYRDGNYAVRLLNAKYSIRIEVSGKHASKILCPRGGLGKGWDIKPCTDNTLIYTAMIKQGLDPSNFVLVDNYPVRKAAQHVIDAAVRETAHRESVRVAAEHAEFIAAIESGEAVMLLKDAPAYGLTLTWGRRLRATEQKKYADWAKNYIMHGFASAPHVNVKATKTTRSITRRQSDGQFCGCDNTVYIITPTEWDNIIAEQALISPTKPLPEPTYGPGYCYNCQTYCYGDCGDYAPRKTNKHNLAEASEAMQEANYGIND